jgi:hypothetical protein
MLDYPKRIEIRDHIFELDYLGHWMKILNGRSYLPTWAESDLIEEIIELRRQVEHMRYGKLI